MSSAQSRSQASVLPWYYPLQSSPDICGGYPFLRLPAPHSNIIVCPPRLQDVDPSVEIMNHPLVLKWMRPTPYLNAQAESWIKRLIAGTSKIMSEIRCESGGTESFVSGCPVRHLHEIQEDGSLKYLGDVGIER